MGVETIGMVKLYVFEMNEPAICTGSSVPEHFSTSNDCLSLQGCRVENLQALKTMKFQASSSREDFKEIGSLQAGMDLISPVLITRQLGTNELSSSLPNLNACSGTAVNGTNEKQTRNSLNNIHSNGILTTLNSETVIKDLVSELRTQQTERGQPDGASNSDSPNLLRPKQIDLPINIDSTNNRLSAVLENIPLYYIPHTKQLVSLDAKGNQAAQNNGVVVKSQSKAKTSPTHSSCSSCTTPVQELPPPSVNGHPKSPDRSQVPGEEACAMQVKNGYICSGAELELSTMLSQDSDNSSNCHSEHTVIQDNFQFDEVSLDRVSKLSIEQNPAETSQPGTSGLGPWPAGETSSFSSVSSLSTATDFSVSAASGTDDFGELRPPDEDESGFMEVNLHSRNSFEKSRNDSQDSGIDDKGLNGAKQKKKGFTNFLARSLFSRKSKDPVDVSDSAPGWKLFGRVPPKLTPQKDPDEIKKEYQEKCRTQQTISPLQAGATGTTGLLRHKKTDIEVSSTTALILENRPEGLPCKDPEEELRHKLEYEAMVEAAKKREQKEAKLRKKQLQRQLQQEEAMATAVKVWNQEILPNWESIHCSKRVKDIWWSGIPPSVRGKVWQLAIGNELNITAELYEICLNRAKDKLKLISESGDSEEVDSANKESSVDLIKLDVSRTFPQLCIFQKGGPYHELLQGLLGAYVCYRPDVGYVQGMSFIAAVLLLNMDVADAFITFTNLLNRPCQVAFFRLDKNLMQSYFYTYEEFFAENLPKLYIHFQKQGITPDLYIIDWMFTMYTRSLPLDVASRVWDVFCRDGEEFLFRTALGILRLYEEILLNMDFIHLAQFLTRLPENIQVEALFRHIDSIRMSIDKKKFTQVLAAHRDNKDIGSS